MSDFLLDWFYVCVGTHTESAFANYFLETSSVMLRCFPHCFTGSETVCESMDDTAVFGPKPTVAVSFTQTDDNLIAVVLVL